MRDDTLEKRVAALEERGVGFWIVLVAHLSFWTSVYFLIFLWYTDGFRHHMPSRTETTEKSK